MPTQVRRKFAIILAAGDGKRMKSDRPKVLCEVLFKPMLCWVEDACRSAGIDEVYIVAGDRAELLKAAASPGCQFVYQKERLGTGHAVMMASAALKEGGDVVVLNGDAPFIDGEVILSALRQHEEQGNAITLVSANLGDPTGYGRIVRGENGRVERIVEQKDAGEKILGIREANAGAYWFRAEFLADALSRLKNENAQKEYYLTDTVKIAVEDGERVGAYLCENSDATLGANDRKALSVLNRIARDRVIEKHLLNGVDIPVSDGIIIGADVEIGRDAQILPGTILSGKTSIGPRCVIGPNSYIKNSTVGSGSLIQASYLTDSTVGENSRIGPFTQLRPDSHVGSGVKIGDFVEVKNSTIGDETSIAHLTYIGDSDVGKQVNFGCGVVTANYDGNHKYRSTIGNRAFIGCNTNLISPVHIGEGAYTAAGTTVDSDVPDGALAIGRVKQEVKEGWAEKNVNFKGEKKSK